MSRNNISVRSITIILFVLSILITVGLIGYIVFSNWLSSTDEIITKMAKDMNTEIQNQIDRFIHVPEHINEVNRGLIEQGIVDINDEKDRERYFVGVLKAHSDVNVYSYSYGTETGEYYGARRNKNNEIEIMKNNKETNGNSWYYSLTEEDTAKDLVVKAGEFDPRTRDWYISAKETKKPIFSPIYKHFVMDDLTVSAAYPIYNRENLLEGVLGTHITLSRVDSFLKETVEDKNAFAVIVEKDSRELVANSLGVNNYKRIDDGEYERLTIDDIDNKAIEQAYEEYKTTQDSNFKLNSEDDKQYINLIEYNKEGLSWLIITAIPESLFLADIIDNMKLTLLMTIIAIILSIGIYLMITKKLLDPIDNLIDTTERFSKGDFSRRATISRNDEIGRITKSFNKMADTIHMLVNNLETKVKERTMELEETNNSLKYLIYHDSLTGLFNRKFFDEKLKEYDIEEKLPLSIIFGDINGLKLTNDIFGHKAGDELLIKSAEILKNICRDKDIISRVGGDEFAILLPNTEDFEAEKIIDRVNNILSRKKINGINCSMSMGYGTKKNLYQDIMRTMEIAEDEMYKEKTLNQKKINSDIVVSIIKNLHDKNSMEKSHSINVSEICKNIGQEMQLSETQVRKLKEAGFLHDIGKIALDDNIIKDKSNLTEEEKKEMQQHTVIGYRILNLFEDTLELAEGVFNHHENWDGSGYPKGIKGEEIPIISRIIAIAENYDEMTNELNKNAMSKDEALQEIIKQSGIKFDPEIVEIFVRMSS
jgi:diguanylate cyclase (GGDEF)-like protein/putative nucleotidyltransferase with HDIG domain